MLELVYELNLSAEKRRQLQVTWNVVMSRFRRAKDEKLYHVNDFRI
jgi:serine/threonine protein kinase HipA of HipAB toxin-antitoxin module